LESKSQEARVRAEADVWASQLVALQDTLRLTRLEAAAAEVELAGRARLAAAKLEKEAAERAGETAAARARAQVMSVEARLDKLKMALYFPKVKVRRGKKRRRKEKKEKRKKEKQFIFSFFLSSFLAFLFTNKLNSFSSLSLFGPPGPNQITGLRLRSWIERDLLWGQRHRRLRGLGPSLLLRAASF